MKLSPGALKYVPLVVAAMLIGDSNAAAACSCFHRPPAELLEKASYVIRGIGPLPWPPEWAWAGDPEFPARTFGQCDGSSLVEYRGLKVEQAVKMLAFLGEPIRTIEVSKPDSTR